jgi:hypothetical protein
VTAEQVATHLNARRVGPRRWQAKCPAHGDGSPSLSICEGRDGRVVLVHCFAGCPTGDVLAKLGLGWADICGEPMAPAQAREAAAERQKREQREQEHRNTDRAGHDLVRKLEAVMDALGDRLARVPEDSAEEAQALARLFHESLSRLREAEAAVQQ